jgi:hypothetical protein
MALRAVAAARRAFGTQKRASDRATLILHASNRVRKFG